MSANCVLRSGWALPTQPLTHERSQGLKLLFECLNYAEISHIIHITHSQVIFALFLLRLSLRVDLI